MTLAHERSELGGSEGSVRAVSPVRVLLLEPSRTDAERIVEALRADGLDLPSVQVDSLAALHGALADRWDVVVTSDALPDATIEEVLTAVRASDPDLSVIVVSQSGGDRLAVEAFRAGAGDVVDKADLGRLAPAVRRAVADSFARAARRSVFDRVDASELGFRVALEGGYDSFFVFEREVDSARGEPGFRLVEMNSHGSAIFGGTREELVGKFFDNFVAPDPDCLAYFSKRFHRVFELGSAIEEDYEVQPGREDSRWLHYQIVPLPNGVAVNSRDITERKRSEEALRESERRFVNVVHHVPGVFFTLVPGPGEGPLRMSFDFLSDGIKSITGHEPHEFEGEDRILFTDLVHPDDQRVLGHSDDLLLAGRAFAVDVRVLHADGTTRWAHLKAEPILDADERVQAASGVMLDITDRKHTEEALRLRERAIEAMTQGLVIIDATTAETPIVYVNPAFEELSGYTLEELVGRSPCLFDGPESSAETIRALDAAIAGQKPFNGEIYTYRKNGQPYWASIRVSPVFDERGKATHFISIHADDTPRRRLEEQFLYAQKMEAVGRLAGGVAHDFNNVLLVIRGYSHVLMDMAGEHGEGWAEAKEIETAAARAAELVRKLVAFSRSQVMQMTVLDVNQVVCETQKLLTPLLGADIDVRLSLGANVGSVKADAMQLEQAIVNLAVNARDAMPSGGSLVDSHRQRPRRGGLPRRGTAAAGRVHRALDRGHRARDGRRDARARLRAVLLDEGCVEGTGPRPRRRVRDDQAERWGHRDRQRPRTGHVRRDLSASRRRAVAADGRTRSRTLRCLARRLSSWSRTTTRRARSSAVSCVKPATSSTRPRCRTKLSGCAARSREESTCC